MAIQLLRRADVCVIGGGPAGATIASELARFGHAVCLVEAGDQGGPDTQGPHRPHPAATLPAGAMPLLERIGVMDSAQSLFLPAKQIVRWWDTPAPVSARLPQPGLHVDRIRFDACLLAQARKSGAHILHPARALRAKRLETGGGWHVDIRHDGCDRGVRCAVIVDASGGRGILPARWHCYSARLVALWAPWSASTEQCPEARLEAGVDEWFWCAPSRPGQLIVSIFIDPARLSCARGDSDGTANGANDLYLRLIERFRLLPRRAAVRPLDRARITDATMRWAADAAGPDFVRIGDASVRLDPVSSQGVQAAIASGLQGAVVVNTLLARPHANHLAVSFYCDRQREHLRRHATRTCDLYRAVAAVSGRPCWRQLGRHAIAPDALYPRDQDRADPNPNALDLDPLQTSPLETNSYETDSLETSALDIETDLKLAPGVRLQRGSVLRGRFIEPAQVVHHATLERPLAFLGSIEIAPLLSDFTSAINAYTAAHRWSSRMPHGQAWEVLHWLWRHQIIVPQRSSQR